MGRDTHTALIYRARPFALHAPFAAQGRSADGRLALVRLHTGSSVEAGATAHAHVNTIRAGG